jgi:hypothetical protein
LFESDYLILNVRPGLIIDKTWLRGYLDELNQVLVENRKKAVETDTIRPVVGGNNKTNMTKLEQQLAKKHQEAVNKKIEASLFDVFTSSPDPFWLNLFLVENCKDYAVNKYNTLACIIAKLFEKWLSRAASLKLASDYDLTEEIRTEAFLIATKYNLLLVDFLSGPYKLSTDNMFLLEFLKHKLKEKIDIKDRAILISKLQMHEHFDLEQVLLPLILQDKVNVLESYLANSRDTQVKCLIYLDEMCKKDACLSDYLQ